jgi:hypothetical protein
MSNENKQEKLKNKNIVIPFVYLRYFARNKVFLLAVLSGDSPISNWIKIYTKAFVRR